MAKMGRNRVKIDHNRPMTAAHEAIVDRRALEGVRIDGGDKTRHLRERLVDPRFFPQTTWWVDFVPTKRRTTARFEGGVSLDVGDVPGEKPYRIESVVSHHEEG